MPAKTESPIQRLERSVANIPYPPKGVCGVGVGRIMDKFPASREVKINGPLKYHFGHAIDMAWRHFVAQLPTGQVIDVCLPPGKRVFPSMRHYMAHSEVQTLSPNTNGQESSKYDPVIIHRGPFRPFQVLSEKGHRVRVSDGRTRARTLPRRNVRNAEQIVEGNFYLRPGKKPSTDFPTLERQRAQIRGRVRTAHT